MRPTAVRLAAVLTTLAVAVSACRGSGGTAGSPEVGAASASATSAAGPATGAGSVPAGSPAGAPAVEQRVVVPAPPAPLTLSADPAQAGRQLAAAFAGDAADRPAALVAAYRSAGIPLSTGGGASFTSAGPVGLPWAMIWGQAGAANPHARFSLSELATVYGGDGKFLAATQSRAVAAELLAGLRAALTTKGSPLATVAHLVQDESGADLAGSGLDAGAVRVGGATATLLVSAQAMVLLDSARTSPNADKLRAEGTALAAVVPGFPTACTPDALGNWILWTASKIGGEKSVPVIGRAWDSIAHTLVDAAASSALGDRIDFAGLKQYLPGFKTVAAVIAAGLTAFTTALAIHSATAQAELKDKPFYRTKYSTYPGRQTDIRIHILYDLGSLPQSQQDALNCVLAALALLGNNSTVSTGGLAHVRVDILGEQGFGQGTIDDNAFVDFPTSQLHADTDDNGDVSFPVEGRAQKHTVPDNAAQHPRTFTVKISSRLDETNLGTAGKTFVDSLLCATGTTATDGLGCLDPISDIVKQFSFDLGDYPFTIVDWNHDFKFKMTLPRTQNPVNSDDSYAITGELQGCLNTVSNDWVYSGTGTVVNHSVRDGSDEPDDRYLVDLVGHQDAEKTLRIAFTFAPTAAQEKQFQDSVPGGFQEDVFTITAATGDPRATLTLHNGLGDKLGDYQMTITPETPSCH